MISMIMFWVAIIVLIIAICVYNCLKCYLDHKYGTEAEEKIHFVDMRDCETITETDVKFNPFK